MANAVYRFFKTCFLVQKRRSSSVFTFCKKWQELGKKARRQNLVPSKVEGAEFRPP